MRSSRITTALLFLSVGCDGGVVVTQSGDRGVPAPSAAAADGSASAVLGATRARFARFSSRLLPPSSTRLDRGPAGFAVAPSAIGAHARLDVTLPSRANGAVVLAEGRGGASVSVRLLGSRETAGTITDGYVVYPAGGPAGADVLHRPTAEGTEDWLVFAGAVESVVRWEVDLGAEVAGLRVVSDLVEAIDRAGVPRIRMLPPYLVDAAGTVRAARVAIDGCAVDTDPRPAFDRAPTDPGARTCTLRLTWDAAGLTYPLLLDPSWSSTGGKVAEGGYMGMSALKNGRVLASGGYLLDAMAIAEVYDPATEVWSVTGSMKNARYQHASISLPTGGVLVVSGAGSGIGLYTAEIYDEASGTFTLTGSLSQQRLGSSVVLLAGGKVLAAGGGGLDAEVWNPSGGAWTMTGVTNPRNRSNATAFALPSGRALLAGGGAPDNFPVEPTIATAEIYDPGTNAWTATGSLATARNQHTGVVLADGRVLVAGGQTGTKAALSSAEIFAPATGTWSSAGTMASPRLSFTSALLLSGKALVVGSFTSPGWTTAEVFEPSTSAWSSAGTLSFARQGGRSATLPSGWVLVASGTLVSEVFRGYLPAGKPCVAPSDCTSGFCADAVCCDTACTGACQACRGSMKASGSDGVCGPVKAGTDPHDGCLDEGSPKCGLDGTCDGAGACAKYAASTGCTPSKCTSGKECATGFCVDGVCCDKACAGKCEACAKALKGSGSDGTCAPWAAGTDPLDRCTAGPACKADGLCDGAGACRDFAPIGSSCGSATCTAGKASGSLCDGAGTCKVSDVSCAPFKCKDASSCATSCVVDSDCEVGSYCVAGGCVTQKANGEAAKEARECKSAILADGVCCATACAALCESCAADTTTKGTCTAVKGDPIHGACPTPPTGSDPCAAPSCDGIARDTCAALVGPEVTCRAAACVSGKELAAATCVGKGKCPAPVPRPCEPYVCGDTACKSSCAGDADCAKGNACDPATKKCVGGATCDGDHTVLNLDGTKKDCAPLKCSGSGCRSACGSSADCVTGFLCDVSTGACVPSTAPTESGGGCAFAEPSREGTSGAFVLAFVGLALGRTLRRPIGRGRK